MGYYEEETRRTAQTDNRESAPYITFIAFPNQISGGLYWNVKYGYKSFEKTSKSLTSQKMLQEAVTILF